MGQIGQPDTYHKIVQDMNSPTRCMGMAGNRRCHYESVEGTQFCSIHGGALRVRENSIQAKRHFVAAQWSAKVGIFADDENLKSLKTEIGILRLLLHNTMSACRTGNDLAIRSSSISSLIKDIEKLVTSCNILDSKLGQMVDKQALLTFGNKVIELVAEFLPESEQQIAFSKRLAELLEKAGRESESE